MLLSPVAAAFVKKTLLPPHYSYYRCSVHAVGAGYYFRAALIKFETTSLITWTQRIDFFLLTMSSCDGNGGRSRSIGCAAGVQSGWWRQEDGQICDEKGHDWRV